MSASPGSFGDSPRKNPLSFTDPCPTIRRLLPTRVKVNKDTHSRSNPRLRQAYSTAWDGNSMANGEKIYPYNKMTILIKVKPAVRSSTALGLGWVVGCL